MELTVPIAPPVAPRAALVVDADEQIRRLLSYVLTSTLLERPCDTTVAVATAEEARHYLRGSPGGQTAVAVVDARLPGESGLALVRLLGTGPHPIPSIILSSRHDPQLAETAQSLGAAACLVKPFTIPAICAAVSGVLPGPSRRRAPHTLAALAPLLLRPHTVPPASASRLA